LDLFYKKNLQKYLKPFPGIGFSASHVRFLVLKKRENMKKKLAITRRISYTSNMFAA